jgi:hypothetical protein
MSKRTILQHLRRRLRAPAFRTWGGRLVHLPEIKSPPIRRSTLEGRRLNLCIPTLVQKHVFGGIATALEFFEALSLHFDNLRIIVSVTDGKPDELVTQYAHWHIIRPTDPDSDGQLILQGLDSRESIAVRRNDYFVGTAWYTALLARDLLRCQKAQFGIGQRRYAYLIQDYEPGFDAFSARFALAEATYLHPEEIVAVFNSGLLREYFVQHNYLFDRMFSFEPRFNKKLGARRRLGAPRSKLRTILIYGRPGTPRNGFPLIVLALQAWAQHYSRAADWRVVSAGEPHPDVPLGNEVELESLGKLTLDQYAELLDVAAIGISLMVSPHPSYPPLEMAAFGMRVITNGFGAKNLSCVHSNIVSVANPEPANLAAALVRLCLAFETEKWFSRDGHFFDDTFLSEQAHFPFCKDLLHALDASPESVINASS